LFGNFRLRALRRNWRGFRHRERLDLSRGRCLDDWQWFGNYDRRRQLRWWRSRLGDWYLFDQRLLLKVD
jgi:hypothetical protein